MCLNWMHGTFLKNGFKFVFEKKSSRFLFSNSVKNLTTNLFQTPKDSPVDELFLEVKKFNKIITRVTSFKFS